MFIPTITLSNIFYFVANKIYQIFSLFLTNINLTKVYIMYKCSANAKYLLPNNHTNLFYFISSKIKILPNICLILIKYSPNNWYLSQLNLPNFTKIYQNFTKLSKIHFIKPKIKPKFLLQSRYSRQNISSKTFCENYQISHLSNLYLPKNRIIICDNWVYTNFLSFTLTTTFMY